MSKLTLLQLILVIIVTQLHRTTAPLTCYRCSDDPSNNEKLYTWGKWMPIYDPLCGAFDYSNTSYWTDVAQNYDTTCFIALHSDGFVSRGADESGNNGGDCSYTPSLTQCYCKGDNCNTHSYCYHCEGGRADPTPAEQTSLGASETQTTSINKGSSDNMKCDSSLTCADCGHFYHNNGSHYTKADDPRFPCYIKVLDEGYEWKAVSYESDEDRDCYHRDGVTVCYCYGNTTFPGPREAQTIIPPNYPWSFQPVSTKNITETQTSLGCYSCFGCAEIDETTPVVENPNYRSCVTKIFLSSHKVVRGGSTHTYIDGECVEDSGTFSCGCASNKCNNFT